VSKNRIVSENDPGCLILYCRVNNNILNELPKNREILSYCEQMTVLKENEKQYLFEYSIFSF